MDLCAGTAGAEPVGAAQAAANGGADRAHGSVGSRFLPESPVRVLVDTDKLVVTFIWEVRGPRVAEIFL